jgi:hypothetical protein
VAIVVLLARQHRVCCHVLAPACIAGPILCRWLRAGNAAARPFCYNGASSRRWAAVFAVVYQGPLTMGFLRNLFGKSEKAKEERGFFLYVVCERCGDRLRIRIDPQYDLNRRDEGGYIWRKTLVDNKCYRPMATEVIFDHNFNVVSAEVDGGRYITREAYEAAETGAKEEE